MATIINLGQMQRFKQPSKIQGTDNYNQFNELFSKILQLHIDNVDALTEELNSMKVKYNELLQQHEQLQRDYQSLRGDPVLSFLHKLYEKKELPTEIPDVAIQPQSTENTPVSQPMQTLHVKIPVAPAVKSPIIIPPVGPINPLFQKPSSVYIPPSNAVTIESNLTAPIKPGGFKFSEQIAPSIVNVNGKKVSADSGIVKRKVGRPKKVQTDGSEEKKQVGPVSRPKKDESTFGPEIAKDAHLVKQAQGDFTLGRRAVDNEWFDNKTDDFIACMVASLYNNITGTSSNKVDNMDNAINNFILAYNYVRNHTNYKFILYKKYKRISPKLAGEPNVEYLKESAILGPIGLEVDEDGFVQRKETDK